MCLTFTILVSAVVFLGQPPAKVPVVVPMTVTICEKPQVFQPENNENQVVWPGLDIGRQYAQTAW